MQIPDDDDSTKNFNPTLELTALYNLQDYNDSKVVAVASFDLIKKRLFSGRVSLFT